MIKPPPHRRKDLPAIFIVEDDAALCAAIGFALEAEGYPVRAFTGGSELLAVDDLKNAGCFVVDHRLPDLGGLDMIKELRRRGLEAPAVMITTAPDLPLLEACWRLGVPIVEKPLLGDSLNSCIRGLLARPLRPPPSPPGR